MKCHTTHTIRLAEESCETITWICHDFTVLSAYLLTDHMSNDAEY